METETTETETPIKEEEVTPEVTTEETETPKISVEDLQKKIVDLENEKNNQKIRAEKAEKKLKTPPVEKKEVETTLSPKDYLAMTEAKVKSEDFDEIVRLSKILGKPIADTLKDKTARAILDGREEERQTAAATNTRGGNAGQVRKTSADIVAKAKKGELPETEEGIDELVKAEWALKTKNIK